MELLFAVTLQFVKPGPVFFADPESRFEPEDTFAMGDRGVQLWRYSWSDGHVRGVDVFRVIDGKVSEKLSYVKG